MLIHGREGRGSHSLTRQGCVPALAGSALLSRVDELQQITLACILSFAACGTLERTPGNVSEAQMLSRYPDLKNHRLW